MSKLNAKATVNGLVKLAEVIIQYNANANYDVETTKELNVAAKELIQSQKLTQVHLNSMLEIRDQYEALIDKKYNTNFQKTKMVSNMLRDTQAYLDSKRVPQRTQVALGLFDMVIGRLYQPQMFA